MIIPIITTTATLLTTSSTESLSLIVNLTLIALLIQKELISGAKGERAMRFSQALNVAIVPLLIAFFATMAFSIADLQR